MIQTVEEKRPYTRFRECPGCGSSIEYWWTSGMSGCFPHFYCESCSNVIWRATDRDRVGAAGTSEALAHEIAASLPRCSCGGAFRPGANPKCPCCGHEFRHNGSIADRLTDPQVILIQGARFTSEE